MCDGRALAAAVDDERHVLGPDPVRGGALRLLRRPRRLQAVPGRVALHRRRRPRAAVDRARGVGVPPARRARPGCRPQSRAARLLSPDIAELDPEVGRVLEAMLAVDGPPAHEVPVDQARAGHEAETEHLSGPGEPVAEVRDFEVEAPCGTIPMRVYRPEGEGPLPIVAYLHGGGWMLG